MAQHDAHPTTTRFRAFTASLGLMSRSPSAQLSAPSVLRPMSATSFRSLYGNFTLYLRVHSAQHLSAVTQGFYCKLYLGDSPMIGGFGQGKSLVNMDKQARLGSSHQTFHTKVQMSAQRGNPEWNEKFQMNVRDAKTEILTIRVKNHVLLYSPALGACVVHLRQLQLGVTVDEWFPLYKNDKPSGQIRLQICLQQNAPITDRRYSQPSEEVMQRMIQEHREQQETARREMELKQQEKGKKMVEDEVKHVGLREQMQREERWRKQCAQREVQVQQQEEEQDSDVDLPASFKNRGVKAEEDVASQLMSELSLKESMEKNQKQAVDSGISNGYTGYGVNTANDATEAADRWTTGFGTIRFSVEELDQVVQNALPTSDSSDSTSDFQQRRRLRKNRDDKKRNRRKSRRQPKRRARSDDESSDTSTPSSREYRKYSSRIKSSEEKIFTKSSLPESRSSQSQLSNQTENRQDWDIPNTLSFPPSSSIESSDEESRRRRRRKAERAKKREKERKRRSKRKATKSLRAYDSSDFSSSSSPSSSSSLSSSEEERLRRKLKKKKAKEAKARALLAESGGSRDSGRTPGMQHSHKADSRSIDYIPYVTQQSGLHGVANTQANDGGPRLPTHSDTGDYAASTVTSSSFASSTNRQQPLYSSKAPTEYGPKGVVGFDEPSQPPMPQYPRQATNEQTNAELMRSFCF